MTIYDVSEKAGVSIATVSRVLNGSDNVSTQTRQKVLAVIEACDYTPNAFARGLGLNSMNTIGILCADSSDLYIANAIYHIEQELRANNYNCILCCTGYELSDKQKYLNLLVNKKVDSVILVGSNYISDKDSDNDYIREAAKEIPILLLNADFDCENVYCSLCDDFKSTLQATTYLLDTGVKDILYLYNSKSYSALRKLSGYQSALTQKGIPLRMEYMQFFPGRNSNLPAIADFLAELDGSIQYNGVIAANDNLALGAAKFAHKKGLKIPMDLSIIGYNNSILSTCCENEHLIILLAVLVQAIPTHGHEDRLFKVRLALAAVANGELGGGGAVQAVQQLRVGQEHGFLVLPAGYLVIDVGETVGLGELAAHPKNAVRPNGLNGYHVLHPAGDAVRLPILPHDGLDTFNHGVYIPPFPAFPCWISKCRSTAWMIQSGVLSAPAVPSAATPK